MAALEPRAASALGKRVTGCRALGGGSLSEVAELTLHTGETVIAKAAPGAAREAAMLRAIAETGCPAPEVLHAADDLLVMSRLDDAGNGAGAAWAEAGRAVARLHSSTGRRGYGWPEDHAFGEVAIRNTPIAPWPRFWAERRLIPTAAGTGFEGRVAGLAERLDRLLPSDPSPSLLHGDLWSGNLLFGRSGFSGLIDPACYHGDREADLAMLTLFGAPPQDFFATYGELSEGWRERRPAYQLWPALVHVRLFGGGYAGLVERLLTSLGV